MIDPQTYYKKINLEEDEEIVEVIRHSPASKLVKAAIALILLALPFFLMFVLIAQGPIGTAVFVSLIILAVYYSYREWFIWKNNVFILTTHKIVDIDQRGFFSRTVSEVPLNKVSDVSYQSKGFWAALLRLGSIMIKTSVEGLSFEMGKVAYVKDVAGKISEVVREHGGKTESPNLSTRQKLENMEDVLHHEDMEKYGEYKIKDLVNEYVETYSKLRLKKLLVTELEKKGDEQLTADR